MAQLPNDTPHDVRARVWKQLYEQLFKDICAPTSQEMMEGLSVRRTMPNGKHEVVTRDMFWEPKPKGWVWDRFNSRTQAMRGGELAWFGIDYAEGYKPVRLPTEEDRAVHRAIVAMQRPTRANEL